MDTQTAPLWLDAEATFVDSNIDRFWIVVAIFLCSWDKDVPLLYISAAGHSTDRRLGPRLLWWEENKQEIQGQASGCKYSWWTR